MNGISLSLLHLIPIFYFLLLKSRESIVLGSNLQSGDFDGFTRFEVLNQKIKFYRLVCMNVCLCACICYQHNSKSNYSRNIKSGNLHLYHVQMLL